MELLTDERSTEQVDEAKAYAHANPSWRGSIIAKLAHYRATDLSDGEIERCLKGCVAANRLAFVAKGLRDGGQLNYSEIVSIMDAPSDEDLTTNAALAKCGFSKRRADGNGRFDIYDEVAPDTVLFTGRAGETHEWLIANYADRLQPA